MLLRNRDRISALWPRVYAHFQAADTRNMANFKTCAPRVLRHPPCAMMVVVCCEKCRRQKLQPQEESANPVQRQ
eukprot:scaffold208528_cov24-Tisochrysis_lutea.AAC.1